MLRAGPLVRWVGTFPAWLAPAVFFGAAALGAILTLALRDDPGGLLGIFIVAGAVVAALGIRREQLYLLIPLPALTYLVLAVLTGMIHDGGAGASTIVLGSDFLQWIANGFFSLCAATILVLLIFGARLLTSRQLVSGSFPMSEQRPPARRPGAPPRAPLSPAARPPAPRRPAPRPSRAPWDDADPWYDQAPANRPPWNSRDSRGR